MSRDPRLRAILPRLRSDAPGERLAALAALERLLPDGPSLLEIIQVGLFYTDRGVVDPSLVEEIERLRGALTAAERSREGQRRRIAALEEAIGEALIQLRASRRHP